MARLSRRRCAAVLAGCAGLALAGCGSSAGLTAGGVSGGAHTSTRTPSGAGMAGMDPGASTSASATLSGSHTLGISDWQGMKIEAATAAPVTFYVADGGSQTVLHRPPAHASFQLTVTLTDAETGVSLPYAAVAAKILNAAHEVVYSGDLYPMLSPSAGSYYGNNVAVGSGTFTLALTVDPPTSARHVEYAHVWMHPHTVIEHFTWPTSR